MSCRISLVFWPAPHARPEWYWAGHSYSRYCRAPCARYHAALQASHRISPGNCRDSKKPFPISGPASMDRSNAGSEIRSESSIPELCKWKLAPLFWAFIDSLPTVSGPVHVESRSIWRDKDSSCGIDKTQQHNGHRRASTIKV